MQVKSLKQYEAEITKKQVSGAKRRLVEDVLDRCLSLHELSGDLEDVVRMLKGYQDRFVDQYQNIYLDVDSYGYEEGEFYVLKGKRFETDAEVRKRLAKRRQDQFRRAKKGQEVAEEEKELIRKLCKKHGLKLEEEKKNDNDKQSRVR
jgi:hypothetical protein